MSAAACRIVAELPLHFPRITCKIGPFCYRETANVQNASFCELHSLSSPQKLTIWKCGRRDRWLFIWYQQPTSHITPAFTVCRCTIWTHNVIHKSMKTYAQIQPNTQTLHQVHVYNYTYICHNVRLSRWTTKKNPYAVLLSTAYMRLNVNTIIQILGDHFNTGPQLIY